MGEENLVGAGEEAVRIMQSRSVGSVEEATRAGAKIYVRYECEIEQPKYITYKPIQITATLVLDYSSNETLGSLTGKIKEKFSAIIENPWLLEREDVALEIDGQSGSASSSIAELKYLTLDQLFDKGLNNPRITSIILRRYNRRFENSQEPSKELNLENEDTFKIVLNPFDIIELYQKFKDLAMLYRQTG